MLSQDWKKEHDLYVSSLNNAEIKCYSTTQRNSFNALWSTEPTRRINRSFKTGYLTMTKRSGFNISIDKPLNPLTPKYVASYKNDPIRNSLIKLSNKPKYSQMNGKV